jgi:hypothetical protein
VYEGPILRSAVIAGLILAGVAPAMAQQQNATTNPLAEVCSGVLAQSNINAGNSDRLCACLVRETPARLTQDEMMAYAEANQNGREPPKAVMDKVTAIATTCLQEAR